jgi:hypothetical protein
MRSALLPPPVSRRPRISLLSRLINLLRHARPWISKTEKGATIYGVEFELDWPDAHLPGSSKISEAETPSASTSNKTKSKNE